MTDECLAVLRANAERADGDRTWPVASWQALVEAGVAGWSVPTEFGGQGRSLPELLDGYLQLASACLTTSFILSQREAAVRRMVESDSAALRRELLRPLACGGKFATVGLSQLTTSRQHGGPALSAHLTDEALTLDGVIPWVTGAAEADHIVIGAVVEGAGQVLAVLPMDTPGVSIGPPLELMALQGSLTAEVHCRQVALDRRWLIRGPVERVMAGSRAGSGGLETSCLALGLSRAAIECLHQESAVRPDLKGNAERLDQSFITLKERMHELARDGSSPETAAQLRARANKLVLQSTQAALTASKGAGFVRSHPAQRWARQAMFFLVWSCPRPAADATLAYLTPEECL